MELFDLFGEGVECLSGFGSRLVVLKESWDEVQRQLLIGSLKQVLQYGKLLTAERQREAVDTASEHLREVLRGLYQAPAPLISCFKKLGQLDFIARDQALRVEAPEGAACVKASDRLVLGPKVSQAVHAPTELEFGNLSCIADTDLAEHALFVAQTLAVLLGSPHDLMKRQTKRVMRDGVDQVCVGFEILAVSFQLLLQTGKVIGVVGPEGGSLRNFL